MKVTIYFLVHLSSTFKLGNRESSSDILLSVKTTEKNHQTRLKLLLETWDQKALEKTFMVSDDADYQAKAILGERFTVTPCHPDHSRSSLSCKQGYEFANLEKLKTLPNWFCHFDDDTFLNYPTLVKTLNNFDYSQDYYLGKSSTNPLRVQFGDTQRKMSDYFSFATGGAGWCLSKSALRKVLKQLANKTFADISKECGAPDDVTVGFLLWRSEIALTEIDQFHSHLENLSEISDFENQITLSYSKDVFTARNPTNIINLRKIGLLPQRSDPSGFKQLSRVLKRL